MNSGYGSLKEWQQLLKEWQTDPDTKDIIWPMCWLFTPITSAHGGENKKYVTDTSVEVIIATQTDRNWHTPERKEKIYKPVLWPLRDEFLQAIWLSGYFDITAQNDLEYTDSDLFYYSTSPAKDQNKLAAYLDAIQLTDLGLKFRERLPEDCLTVKYFNVVHNGENVVHDGKNVTHKVTA